MKNKRLLILAPMGCSGMSLIKSSKKMDLKTIVVTCASVYAEYSEETKKMVDDFLIVDYSDEQSVIDKVCKYAKNNNVDGVVAGFEFSSSLAVRIANKLKLPTNDPDRADACREKHLMYRIFQCYGVPMAKTYECSTLPECIRASLNLGFPVILKPSADAGSVNVLIADNVDAIKTAFEKIRSKQHEIYHNIKLNDTVLLQEYLRGKEVSVEVVVSKGAAHIISVVDKITTHGPYFAELGHTLPSCLDIEEQAKIRAVAEQAVFALGIINGVAHVEIKLTSTGPKVVEVGARLPGDKIVDLLYFALGVDEAAAYIRIALGRDPDIKATKSQFAAIRFKMPPKKGHIKNYVGIEQIKILPSVKEVELYKEVNSQVNSSDSNLDRMAHIITVASKYEEARDVGDAAISNLQAIMEE